MHPNTELLDHVRKIFDQHIPFNLLLGLTVHRLDLAGPAVRFAMRPELVGNFVRQTLHGGVISSVLDVTGGLTAFLGILSRHRDDTPEKAMERFGRLGTIDMRVDYLRPGRGTWFEASGFLLRTGSRVAVTRMELVNDQSEQVAVGTGTYIIS